jgi:hypothetical protein
MGKLASWGLIDHKNIKCTQCGMLKMTPGSQCMAAKTNCCRDEHKEIKTDKDQKLIPSEFFKYSNLSQAIALNGPAIERIKAFSIPIAYPNTNAPPLFDKLPRFILYRNFRI